MSAGGIRDLSAETTTAPIEAEVCVIGSGPAGATAARVLSEAGRDVVILEEGGDRTGKALHRSEPELYDQLYMERGGRSTEDMSINVLQGRALGGGSVINVCDVVPMPPGVLAHWRKQFGLTEMTDAALAPHRARTLADLSAAPIAEAAVNRANALLRDGARKLGLRGELMHHNREGCEDLGRCMIGCPADAKRNARLVAIPQALRAGARVLLRARAVAIRDAQSETKRVEVRALDARGHRETRTLEVRARVVIVAANAIGSAQLLLRSGVGNRHVGKFLMLQPQLPVIAMFDERVAAFEGIPQAFAITEHERDDHPEYGLWGFRIEGIMGTPGMASSLLPVAGHDAKAWMVKYPHMAAALLLVPDVPSGVMELASDGRPILRYRHRDDHKARLRQAIALAARAYFAAGARQVMVPITPPLILRSEADLKQVEAIDFRPATAPLISAHQQGTVRMGPAEHLGAVDPRGRVWGARDVYVFDSSVFPSSASSHTMAPIMTVASWLATALAASLRS